MRERLASSGRPATISTLWGDTDAERVGAALEDLLSPPLFVKVQSAGVFRKGVWGGTNGTLWPHYPEMTQATHAGSDHAAIWVELNVG